MPDFRVPFRALAFVAALAFGAGEGWAQTNEELCNERIGTAVSRLTADWRASFGACIDKYACAIGNLRITQSENALRDVVSGPTSQCRAAVDVDGVPLSSFGPSTCPAAWYGCDVAVPAIASLEDLAECLVCVSTGHDRKLRAEFDFSYPGEKNERRCARSAKKGLMSVVGASMRAVTQCAEGGMQPFSCAVDPVNDRGTAKAVEKVTRLVGKCRDADGEPAVSGRARWLCNRSIETAADLADCIADLGLCVACETSNAMFGQQQDCRALTSNSMCRLESIGGLSESVYVANEGDDTVTFFDRDGNYRFGTLAASSFPTSSSPSAVAANSMTNLVYVANRETDSVTFFDATTGEHLNGNLMNSTFAVGSMPSALVVDIERGTLWVANEGDGTVTVLDAFDGSYVAETLAASTIAVGAAPRGLALNAFPYWYSSAHDGIVYVTSFADGTVTYLDAQTHSYLYGTQAASTFPAGAGASGVAYGLDDNGEILVANRLDSSVTLLDSVTGAPLVGSLLGSTVFIGGEPKDVVATPAPGGRGFLVADAANDAVRFFEASRLAASKAVATTAAPVALANAPDYPDRLYLVENGAGTLSQCQPNNDYSESSPYFGVGPTGRMTHNSSANRVHVSTGYYYGSVTYLDSSTGAFINPGPYQNSQFQVETSTYDLKVNEAANLLYALSANGSVTFLDSTTGAYAFGTLANSTFQTGGTSYHMVVSPELNRLYVSNNNDATVTIFDATTGAYANGTFANSNIAVGGFADFLEVSGANNRLYVTANGNVVVLDATTGAYANGTLAASTTVVGGNVVAVNDSPAIVYAVTSEGFYPYDTYLVYLDGLTGAYLNGTLAASRISTGKNGSAVALDDDADTIYVGENTSGGKLLLLDSLSVSYKNGTFGGSTVDVGGCPGEVRAITVSSALDRIHVLCRYYVVYMRRSTLEPINETFEYSTFSVYHSSYYGNGAFRMWIDEANNLLYVEGALFMNATTGGYAYWGRTCSDTYASSPTGPSPSAVAVMPEQPQLPY